MVELRVPREDEFVDFMRPVWRGFGDPEPTDAHVDDTRLLWELDRSIGALDGTEWVGAAGAFTFDVTLPGGTTAPVAGVTMVGVAATHRRQGILRTLMARQLDDIVDRGEPLAALTASETGIYGRFGYGWAAEMAGVEIETTRSAFRTAPSAPGRVRSVRLAEAAGPMAAAYERSRLGRAGTLTRADQYWELVQRDRDWWRHGASALFVVVHDDADGEPDGYATYRVRFRWESGLPNSTVVVEDLVGTDAEVEATLWRFLCDIDLAAKVEGTCRPVDDPVRWRLVEPRRLRTTEVSDYLWVRVLDVPTALAARRYGRVDGLVVEVVDEFRPASGGRFRLDGGPDGAECTRTDSSPDLVLGAEELGSIFLGGVAPGAMAAARRIEECTPGAVARADALFMTTPAPFNGTMF